MRLFWLFVIHMLDSSYCSTNTKFRNEALPENNDSVHGYAEVRALLKTFYEKTARKYGGFRDYNPEAIKEKLQGVFYNDGTELSVNRNEGIVADLFENDIFLTLSQAKELLSASGKTKRQAILSTSNIWTKTNINYKFGIVDENWRNIIRKGLKLIESTTCIRFTENGAGRDFLYYTRGNGCWSNVGRIGGRQIVSIGYGCESPGIVTHETLHALGLWHEQSRNDRDSFININFQSIVHGTEGNFEKRSPANTDNMNQPYDLGSVMHYGQKAFSHDYNRQTITTKDPDYQYTIGQRKSLSFKDAKMINIRYCSRICPYRQNCLRGGYTDPNNCNSCICPEGLTGSYCQDVQKSETPNCGGILYTSTYTQTITAPKIDKNLHCIWQIKSLSKVYLRINNMILPCRDSCTSYAEVKYLEDMTSTGPRFCCKEPLRTIESQGTDIILIYSGASDADTRFGNFKFSFWTDGPEYVLTNAPARTTTGSPIMNSTIAIRTTTPAITSTIYPYAGYWSNWGQWSECSVTCGGCGRRVRVRACYGITQDCKGPQFDQEECGEAPCEVEPPKGLLCKGKLLLPCELVAKLEFGTLKEFEDAEGCKQILETS